MGFKYWWGGLIVISGFWILIGAPCAVVAFWGSKMINDLGNHPSNSIKIQVSVWWIYLVELFFFGCLVAYGSVLYYWNLG
jgi:hypothetical protein